jgi:rSAM-associated Gly-rich repeat protein
MSLRQKYRNVLSELMPAGAVGLSLLLGSTMPGNANRHSADQQSAASDLANVSERLAAVRQAVSDVAGGVSELRDVEQQLAWGNWRNGGWRNGGWRNGWHNGGWHNGGWHNGGWHNW